MTEIYGIKNCDTMKKALAWLEANGRPYVFIDYKKTPPSRPLLEGWLDRIPWQDLINRKGTTWRKLSDAERQGLNRESACHLMLAHPSLIRRPILTSGSSFMIGFDEAAYRSLLGDRDD